VFLSVVRAYRVHARNVLLARALALAVLLLSLSVSAMAVPAVAVSSAELQTALRVEKPVYKVGELVRMIFLVYSPSAEPTVLHFSDGCWAKFLVEDSLGRVWRNDTRPFGCDYDPVNFERVTNQVTLDPRYSRRSDMYWEQNDQNGEHVPVPQDYVLTVRVLSLEPGLFATTRITISSEIQSASEAWGARALTLVLELPVVFGLMPAIVGNLLANRAGKAWRGWKGWRGFMADLPSLTVVAGVAIYYLASFLDELYCESVDCSETFALISLTRTLSLALVALWLGLLALVMATRTGLWAIRNGLSVGLSLSALFALMNMQILSGLWNHMLYHDWGTEVLSFAILWTMPFGLWLSFRIFPSKDPNQVLRGADLVQACSKVTIETAKHTCASLIAELAQWRGLLAARQEQRRRVCARTSTALVF